MHVAIKLPAGSRGPAVCPMAGLYVPQNEAPCGSFGVCSGVLTSYVSPTQPPELPPLQGPDLCARPELTTWASLPSGFMSLLGHGAACHLVLTLDSTLPLPACIGSCFSSCPHRKARPGAEGQPAMQTCKLVQGRAPRTGREHCSPTYRPVQHSGDEVIADPFHLVSRQLRPVQLLGLSKDGAFGIHPNDLQRGDR